MPQDTVWLKNREGFLLFNKEEFDTMSKESKQFYYTHTGDKRFERKINWSEELTPLFYVLLILAVTWIIIRIRDGRSKSYVAFGSLVNNEADYDIFENNNPPGKPDYLLYRGSELGLTEPEIITILHKRSNYYRQLPAEDKVKFLHRIQKFISRKDFYIHDKSGFKEMPVLISAAAIQLSFGLDKYLLPDFPTINIFPEEFIKTEPTIRFLEGNVSDNSINISWKHFLHGFNSPADGQNVGLHELAHAYYFQNFETGNQIDDDFVNGFPKFNHSGNKVFVQEQQPGYNFYSEYAMKNFQEFWAESVEKFFERPTDMKQFYPELYATISELLNQNPLKQTGA